MEEDGLIRFFRELCGTYYPLETAYNKRFVLTVNSTSVPIFVGTNHKEDFPEIQITPFVADREYFVDEQKEIGVSEDPLDNPEMLYLISDRNIHFKEAKFALNIYATNLTELVNIKKAIKKRFWKFINAELGEFSDSTNFVMQKDEYEIDTGIYISLEYNTDLLDLARVEEIIDDERQVLVEDETLSEAGTWFLDDERLYVYPYTNMDNIRFIEVINGLVFSDGFCTKEKGLKQLITETSTKGYDTNPDIDRWTMMLKLRFRDTEDKTVGRSFAEVEVDAETD
jgi:hypothetical protein